MAKVITFEYDNANYTLEYTRESVRLLESRGFRISDMVDKPNTIIPLLFEGAFLAHHRNLKKARIEEMFEKFPNKNELLSKLYEMYNEPAEVLFAEPEDDEGNVEWGASW